MASRRNRWCFWKGPNPFHPQFNVNLLFGALQLRSFVPAFKYVISSKVRFVVSRVKLL